MSEEALKYWNWALACEKTARDYRRRASRLQSDINGSLCAGVGAVACNLTPVVSRSGKTMYVSECPVCGCLLECNQTTDYRISEHRRG